METSILFIADVNPFLLITSLLSLYYMMCVCDFSGDTYPIRSRRESRRSVLSDGAKDDYGNLKCFLFISTLYKINKGYLLFGGWIPHIFHRVRWKNRYFSWVRSTSENADIFTALDEIYLVFTEKSKLPFYFILNGRSRKHNLTFSLVVTRSIWLFQCVYRV